MKLPAGYRYVFAGLFCTVLANAYLVFNVARLRRRYGVAYPALYADEKTCAQAHRFNCAQRAHQNTVENIATVQLLGALNGLVFPRFSAACLATYAAGRVLYGRGYTERGPDGRLPGAILSHLGDVPLWLCTAYNAAV